MPWDKLPAPLANLMIATVEAVCADKGVVDLAEVLIIQQKYAAKVCGLEHQLVALRKSLTENVRLREVFRLEAVEAEKQLDALQSGRAETR